MVDVKIDTPAKIDLLARILKDLGDKELRRELYAGLNRATKPLRDEATEEAGRRLPHSGGLAAWASRSRLSARRLYGRNPGVQIVARPPGRGKAGSSQLGFIDRGGVRHPVFGNRSVWVTQQVTAGWFSEPMEDGRDEVAGAIVDMLDDLAVKVARRVDG